MTKKQKNQPHPSKPLTRSSALLKNLRSRVIILPQPSNDPQHHELKRPKTKKTQKYPSSTDNLIDQSESSFRLQKDIQNPNQSRRKIVLRQRPTKQKIMFEPSNKKDKKLRKKRPSIIGSLNTLQDQEEQNPPENSRADEILIPQRSMVDENSQPIPHDLPVIQIPLPIEQDSLFNSLQFVRQGFQIPILFRPSQQFFSQNTHDPLIFSSQYFLPIMSIPNDIQNSRLQNIRIPTRTRQRRQQRPPQQRFFNWRRNSRINETIVISDDEDENLDEEIQNQKLWFLQKNKQYPISQLTAEQLQKYEECIICFEPFGSSNETSASKAQVIELFCEHFFHKQCITKWLLQSKPCCPCCRADFRKNEAYKQWDVEYQRRILGKNYQLPLEQSVSSNISPIQREVEQIEVSRSTEHIQNPHPEQHEENEIVEPIENRQMPEIEVIDLDSDMYFVETFSPKRPNEQAIEIIEIQ